MNKWKALGQAFENVGSDLLIDCENMGTLCENVKAFEELYSLYAMMLETIKAQHHFICTRFDEIDDRECR